MRHGNERGFTYVMALLLVATMGAGLAGAGQLWSKLRQREKEAELLWIGNQFAQAIALHYERTPGSIKLYPRSLEDLVQDKRFLTTQRYLRRIYRDPITGTTDWGLVRAPDGGVMGVYSTSERQAMMHPGSSQCPPDESASCLRYRDWKFCYQPAATVVRLPISR